MPMTKTDYAKQRKDPRWQKKRLQIMERDNFKCTECEDEGNTLNVHHAYYVSGRKPWQYPEWALTTLCRDCQKVAHEEDEDFPEDGCRQEWETYIAWISVKAFGKRPCADLSCLWDMMASFAQCLDLLGKKSDYPMAEMTEILVGTLGQLAHDDHYGNQ